MNDVIIVGGGPAGLYAGAKLARAGFAVTLFEEHRAVGEPVHCTGVLAREAFDEFALPTDAILNDLTTVRFHAPTAGTIDYSTPTVEAVVIDRRIFDRTVAELAEASGVRVRCGDRVSHVAVDADGVTVRAGATKARARVRAGVRRQLRDPAPARARHPEVPAPHRAGGTAGRAAGRRRSALRRTRRAARLRVGGAGRPRGPPVACGWA